MKRLLVMFFAVSLLAALAGCRTCDPCGPQECSRRALLGSHHALCPVHGNACGGRCGAGQASPDPGLSGPVTYPYYTLRGPRDFLQRVPTPIGP